MRGAFTIAVTLAGVLFAGVCEAAPVSYTSYAAFSAALGGFSQQTLNFDAETAGTTIATGSSVGGITFTYTIPGFSLSVENTNDTVSPSNYLGTTGDGVFLSGDAFTMTFGARNAIGLYIIADDTILAGDFSLSGGLGVATNGAAAGQLADGGTLFFLGIVDTDNTFTTATLSSAGPFGFIFNVDDITTATAGAQQVPEPASLLLFGI